MHRHRDSIVQNKFECNPKTRQLKWWKQIVHNIRLLRDNFDAFLLSETNFQATKYWNSPFNSPFLQKQCVDWYNCAPNRQPFDALRCLLFVSTLMWRRIPRCNLMVEWISVLCASSVVNVEREKQSTAVNVKKKKIIHCTAPSLYLSRRWRQLIVFLFSNSFLILCSYKLIYESSTPALWCVCYVFCVMSAIDVLRKSSTANRMNK